MRQILNILFIALTMTSCSKEQKLFKLLDSSQTRIDFNNQITEYDSLNILNTEFIYNGGGVGIGDMNGDGLQDIFFTGNQVENKLYLNKGNLRFEDITQKANIQKQPHQWSSGINLIDINQDGKLDIYVSNTFHPNPELRKNTLYINTGNNTEVSNPENSVGVPQFAEMAQTYGIDDTTHSSNAQFFDFDNDGDLDLFIAVNVMDTKYPNQYFPKVTDGTSPNRDKLLRNDWNDQLGHPVFTDISPQAGIKLSGYSHSCLITDFNEDGWQDIYVANDYVTNDLVYINQKNGTFKNEVATIFKHQAASAMGSDVADINNDGKLDFFTTEMLPYHNKRKKLFLNANNYTTYINNETYGYEYQYARNVLQLNRGVNPKTGLPTFSDIAFMGNVQETEWSWTPLMADFDNDGKRDIFITNGFPRDVTDHDFGAYRSDVSYLISELALQKTIPQIKVPKFAFKNQGDLTFKDCSKEWGVDISAFSNGAAYADLDNDGDLDLVVNNINDKAFVFQNTVNDVKDKKPNFIRLHLVGDKNNPDAIGTKVTAFFNGEKQAAQVESARGYISSSEKIIHLGLGTCTKIDSVVIEWAKVGKTLVTDLKINEINTIRYDAAKAKAPQYIRGVSAFEDIDPKLLGLDYLHKEEDYIDFNVQKTLPHKFSQYGPSVAVGDVNGDSLDDIYVGGSAKNEGTWFTQTTDGKFVKKSISYKKDLAKSEEELGTVLFDADNDGDNDLYIVRGSYQYEVNSPFYQDVLCINDGKGNFKIAENALPAEMSCGQAIKAVDYDGDGDLDLFVGGRVLPKSYPKTDRSFILRNDSPLTPKGGAANSVKFTDVTKQVCPELEYIGLVSDALFTDFDNDNQPDLIIAGEWMPLTFFKNEKGIFRNVTNQTGLADKLGWWTSLTSADFDNDGDIDYVAGNFGQNTYFKCTSNEPLSIYAKDFDKNGLYDPFISCYWRDTAGQKQEYFYHTRDDMIKQLVLIRRKFQTYGAFGAATVKDVFTAEELKGAQILKANWMYTSYIENLGNGKFKISALPYQAQIAPINGMSVLDYDGDGLQDVLMVGNDYGMELLQGRADAFYGLLLKNMGGGQFKAIEMNESGFYVPNDARALARVSLGNQKSIWVATQNKGLMKVFTFNLGISKTIPLSHVSGLMEHSVRKNEVKAEILLKNGQKQLREFYWGNAFLSQESRSILMDNSIKSVTVFDNKNKVTRQFNNGEVQ